MRRFDSGVGEGGMYNTELFDQFKNVAHAFYHGRSALPEAQAYLYGVSQSQSDAKLPTGREWREVRNREWLDNVDKVSTYLHEQLGVQKGDRVAIISNTRPEWVTSEMAIFSTGATVVSAYATDSAEKIGYILHDSKAKIVFAENKEQVEKIAALMNKEIVIPAIEGRPEERVKLQIERIISFEKVFLEGEFKDHRFKVQSYGDLLTYVTPSAAARSWLKKVSREDEASIQYTSGTTGPPKGVVITHGQILSNVKQIVDSEIWYGAHRILHLLLSAAHAFQQRMDQFTALLPPALPMYTTIFDRNRSGLTPEGRQSLKADMKSAQSDILCVVPRLLEAIKQAIELKVEEKPFISRMLTKAAIWTAQHEFKLRHTGENLKWALFQPLYIPMAATLIPLISRKIKAELVGENFQRFISGGSALPIDVAAFFGGLKMLVCEGYGTTEVNCPVAVNTPREYSLRSVGRFFKDVEYKISAEGELLVRGPNVARGYHNRPQATAKVFDAEGWYHTGDQAVERDGFIYLSGRNDSVIKTSHGEKIQAETLENKMREVFPFIQDVIVVGNGRPYLVALVSVNAQLQERWLSSLGGEGGAELLKQRMMEVIAERINPTCEHRYEYIRDIAIIPELVIGKGLNSAMKVQRHLVESQHPNLIEEMYARQTSHGAPRSHGNPVGIALGSEARLS